MKIHPEPLQIIIQSPTSQNQKQEELSQKQIKLQKRHRRCINFAKKNKLSQSQLQVDPIKSHQSILTIKSLAATQRKEFSIQQKHKKTSRFTPTTSLQNSQVQIPQNQIQPKSLPNSEPRNNQFYFGRKTNINLIHSKNSQENNSNNDSFASLSMTQKMIQTLINRKHKQNNNSIHNSSTQFSSIYSNNNTNDHNHMSTNNITINTSISLNNNPNNNNVINLNEQIIELGSPLKDKKLPPIDQKCSVQNDNEKECQIPVISDSGSMKESQILDNNNENKFKLDNFQNQNFDQEEDEQEEDDDEEQEKFCRICKDDDEEDDPLVTPCNCKGSIKYVHHHCLYTWVTHQLQNMEYSGDEYILCEICKGKYAYEDQAICSLNYALKKEETRRLTQLSMIGTLLGFILLATLIVILIQIEKAHGSFNDYFIGCVFGSIIVSFGLCGSFLNFLTLLYHESFRFIDNAEERERKANKSKNKKKQKKFKKIMQNDRNSRNIQLEITNLD